MRQSAGSGFPVVVESPNMYIQIDMREER